MRVLAWILRAAVFFTLFAFALNNRDPVSVHGFFGMVWTAPLVIVVLVAFAAGSVIGVVAMVPSWWRRRAGRRTVAAAPATKHDAAPATGEAAIDSSIEHPPRIGL